MELPKKREELWRDFLFRSESLSPFPRQVLRKRYLAEDFSQFKNIMSAYNGKTDCYYSLNSNAQMAQQLIDTFFLEIDCYTELGEDLDVLNEYAGKMEDFFDKSDIYYRRLFSGNKGVHYYISFEPTEFKWYSNAARIFADKIPKVKRPDYDLYVKTGEIIETMQPIYDTRTVGNLMQMVRLPYTIHPKTGLTVVECYSDLKIYNKPEVLDWHPELNAHFLDELKFYDEEPQKIIKPKDVNFDLGDSPACIISALSKLSGHLTHSQAWHLCNYLITVGASDREIQEIFSLDRDYNYDITQVQIDSIRDAERANYSCKNIQRIGLCDVRVSLSCPMWPSIDRYLMSVTKRTDTDIT